MGSKKFDSTDRVSGKKVAALRREEQARIDELERKRWIHQKEWSFLCGNCGLPIGECECYSG